MANYRVGTKPQGSNKFEYRSAPDLSSALREAAYLLEVAHEFGWSAVRVGALDSANNKGVTFYVEDQAVRKV